MLPIKAPSIIAPAIVKIGLDLNQWKDETRIT